MLNKTQRRITAENLRRLANWHNMRLDAAHDKHRTHAIRKTIARDVYELNKAIDVIIKKLNNE
jgi:hypothetical protein